MIFKNITYRAYFKAKKLLGRVELEFALDSDKPETINHMCQICKSKPARMDDFRQEPSFACVDCWMTDAHIKIILGE